METLTHLLGFVAMDTQVWPVKRRHGSGGSGDFYQVSKRFKPFLFLKPPPTGRVILTKLLCERTSEVVLLFKGSGTAGGVPPVEKRLMAAGREAGSQTNSNIVDKASSNINAVKLKKNDSLILWALLRLPVFPVYM